MGHYGSSHLETFKSDPYEYDDLDITEVQCPDCYMLIGCACYSENEHCVSAWTNENNCYALNDGK